MVGVSIDSPFPPTKGRQGDTGNPGLRNMAMPATRNPPHPTFSILPIDASSLKLPNNKRIAPTPGPQFWASGSRAGLWISSSSSRK